MFENIVNFFKRFGKNEKENSKSTAKERLHLVLAQDRANISADFLEMMKQEIIEVIKKYIDIDEEAIDVRMTNKPGEDGTVGAPALYANIPIVTIKNEARKLEGTMKKEKNIEREQTKKGEMAEEIDKKAESEKQEIEGQEEKNNQKTEEEQENLNDVEEKVSEEKEQIEEQTSNSKEEKKESIEEDNNEKKNS